MNTNLRTRTNIVKDEEGVIMLEFAASIIILLLLYVFLINVGLRVADMSAIPKVARDGARQAAVTGNLNDGYSKAQQSAWVWGLDTNKLNINLNTYSFGSRQLIDCDVEYTSSPFSRMFPTVVGGEALDDKKLRYKATFGWWDVE
ncbi:TadE/TadG family type IV pilus assembly protein [Desulfofalx alkaliphila]|uniref:TadE/TadG family type IV pilus assembly protein n=1 Tax=Desulfofalx alkaliphila TaxID=105483 RepID=UPI0012FEE3F3|nr:hypothetical protein [Desulfofalx alkaliphila]